jgi:Skp family chaperone for outer membrane proteins
MSRVLLAAIAAALVGGPALAQSSGGQGTPLGGPPVAGLCLLSQQAVLVNAQVGVAANARLQQITEQVQAELGAERASLEADAKTLDSQRAGLKAAEFQQRQAALQTRLQALQQKAQQRSREIDATREKAIGQITTVEQPLIAAAYKAHNCGLLVDRNAVLGGNMSGDLTSDVVHALDAKMTTITFDREILPDQPAG